MELRQPGAHQGAEQPGASSVSTPQMEGSQPKPVRAPVQAAFGSVGGGALVFRDYASL